MFYNPPYKYLKSVLAMSIDKGKKTERREL